jgi:hypothetical protein
MKDLKEHQIENLWQLLGIPAGTMSYHANREAFILFLTAIYDKFGESFNLSAISTGNEAYADELKLYGQLIPALGIRNNSLVFNPARFHQLTENFQQSSSALSLRELHAQNANQSVLDKLLLGTFTSYEWLSDLDLRRLLEITNTKDKIKITRFNKDDIGITLHFAREAGLKEVGLIINKGAGGLNEGVHWFAVTVTIADDGSIAYSVEDSLTLSDHEREEIRQIMSEGIKYQHTSYEGDVQKEYYAYPNAVIKPGIFKATENQRDAFSCGYRSAHALMQNKLLCGNHANALLYARTPLQTSRLVKCFCELQLNNLPEGLQVERRQAGEKVVALIESKADVTNDDGVVSKKVTEKLNAFNPAFGAIQFPGKVEDGEQLSAHDYYAYLIELRSKLIARKCMLAKLDIVPCDIEALKGLSQFCNDFPDLRFLELTLHLYNASLDETKDELKFETQSLLKVLADKPLTQLKFVDEHNSLEVADWTSLCEFMINRKIAVDVVLPEPHLRSDLQRKLDRRISENQVELAAEQAKQSVDKLKKLSAIKSQVLRRPKRSRGKDMVAGINIEMNREQQQQQEVKVETRSDASTQADQELVPKHKTDVMSFEMFMKAVLTQQLDIPSHSYHYSYDTLESRFRKWFGQVQVNGQFYSNPDISGGTKRACGKLFQFTMQFDQGVDYNNLPAGFILINDTNQPGRKILDYDDKLAEEQKQNKLAVVCRTLPPLKPVPYSIYKACKPFLAQPIQDYLKKLKHGNYDRAMMRQMLSYVSTLALLPINSQEFIWNKCYLDSKLSLKRFSYYLENLATIAFQSVGRDGTCMSPLEVPIDRELINIAKHYPVKEAIQSELLTELVKNNDYLKKHVHVVMKLYKLTLKNINAMFQVYAHKGEAGLLQLTIQLEQMRPQRSKDLMYTFYNEMPSFEPLLTPEYQHSAKIIDALDETQYSWWKLLAKKHCDHHTLDDLPSSLAAFQEFLVQIDRLGLKLYPIIGEQHFEKVSNLKTSLGYILTILEKTKVEDRPEVWKSITSLTLQSDSELLAISTPGCSFVVPEMQCTPSHFNFTSCDKRIRGYRNNLWTLESDDWHHVAVKQAYLKEDNLAKINTGHFAKVVYNDSSPGDVKFLKYVFYRNLAFKTNRLSLSFYRSALARLEEKIRNIPSPEDQGIIFSRLAAFLLSATGYSSRSSGQSTEDRMLAHWETVIELLINPPVPKIATSGPTGFFIGLKYSPEEIKKEAREEITSSLFKFKSLPSLSEMATLLNDVKLTVDRMTFMNRNDITAELHEKLERIEKILNAFGGDVLTQGRQFYAETSNDLSTYLDLSWKLYQLDENRNTKLKAPGDNRPFTSASQHGKLFMSLLSTFNINTPEQLNSCYNTLFSMTYYKGIHNQDFDNLFTDLLKSLQGITLNSVNGVTLTPKDFIKIANMAHQMLMKNIHLLEAYTHDRHSSKSIDSYNQLRWQMIGQELLKTYGASIQSEHVENILTHSSKRDNLNIIINKLFKDLKPIELVKSIERFTGRYTSELERDQTILDNLRKILTILNEDQRKRFIQILSRDQIWHASSFTEIQELVKLIAENPLAYSADFFYICDQSVANKSENLVKAAQIYIDTIVPSLPTLPGLKRFDTLPLAASLLLRESTETIGQSPSVSTPAIEFWNKVMALLANPKNIQLKDIEALWESAPEKSKCKALAQVFNEIKQLHEAKNSTSALGKALNTAGSLIKSLWGATPTPQSTEISKSLIEVALSEAGQHKEEEYEYKAVFLQFIQRISTFNERYPLVKYELMTFINNCIATPLEEGQSLMAAVWKNLDVIETISREVKDEKVIRSLLFWYSGGPESVGKPEFLMFLVKALKSKEARNSLLRVITKLLDNNHKIDEIDIITLYTHLLHSDYSTNESAIAKLDDFYQSAPYPTLKRAISWLECEDEDLLAQNRLEHNIAPCPRDPANGFHYDEAVKQNELCVGLHFTNELRDLEAFYEIYKGAKTDELLKAFHLYKAMKPAELKEKIVQLVAITAELMYRAKGIPAEGNGKDNSHEINTTQYLSVLALLKGADHTTAGISTGEGKSRIMMIVNACMYALGKTTDFITSDVVLGKRDFLAAQSLFNLIGAESSLIYADSPFSTNKLGGINYSDPSNISLFRNRAYSAGMGHLVIERNPRKRALMLDEADKAYYDMSDTKFNYSAETDETIVGMEWIYPLLIKFLKDPSEEVKKAYNEDIDTCTDMFLTFARANGCTDEQVERMENMRTQVDTWLTSAAIALKLKYKVHFNVKGDILINTANGPVMASDIPVIVHKRDVIGAKFSSGVHQCLTAHINLLKDKPDDSNLSRDVTQFQNPFHMEPEKCIVYSSTAQDMLDDYQEGTIIAVTGSPGVEIEMEEARRGIAYNDESGSQMDMRFIFMPRHEGLKRVDKPVLLTDNENSHHQAIIAAIEKAMIDAQPVLLICENDTDSEALLNILKNANYKTSQKPKLQRIHSGAPEEEDQLLKEAGAPFTVTISTSMIGRGTDISVKLDATLDSDSDPENVEQNWEGVELNRGLKVLCTYLPTSRELEQIFGRGGRKGQPGDAQLILNKQKLPADFQMDNDDDESKIIKLQAWMDRKNQCKRLVLKANSRFRKQLYNKYLAVVPNIQQPFILFETQANQEWALVMAHIRDEINKDYPNVDIIQKHLKDYRESVELNWLELCSNTSSANPEHELPVQIPELSLDQHSIRLLQHFDLADALAPAQLNKILKLLDNVDGVYEALCLLNKYVNHSPTAKAALIKRAEEEREYNSPHREKYDFILSFCNHNDNDLLLRVINTYVNQPVKTSKQAELVVRLIKQFIENTTWDGWLKKVSGTHLKLPSKIKEIYKTITREMQNQNPDYPSIITTISRECANFNKPVGTVAERQRLNKNDHFLFALKHMHDRLQPRPQVQHH